MSSMIADDSETMDTAMDVNFDYMFKVLMVGNSGVGKTAFVTRYCDDHFNPAFISTVGIDFRVKNLIRHNKRIKLQMWDTAGQERYQAITTAYYHGAMGFIVLFDVTQQESFDSCRNWISQIKELALQNAVIILAGNKIDLDDRIITQEQAMEFASALEIPYYEVSAKDNINVTESVEKLVDNISETMAEAIEKNPHFYLRGIKPREPSAAESKSSSSCSC